MKTLLIDRDYAGCQTIGSRNQQQDAYALSLVKSHPPSALASILLVVADGIGGHAGGREASATVVQGFVESFLECGAAYATQPARALGRSLKDANNALAVMINTDFEHLADAGTTLLATVLNRESLHWISVGDSPLFLWRNNQLLRLNEDHSMRTLLARKVAAGQLRPTDLETHPQRNMLFSALNGVEPEKVDAPPTPFPLQSGDILLAASDGILTLQESEISEVLSTNPAQTALELAQNLLAQVASKKLPAQDNTTVTVVKI